MNSLTTSWVRSLARTDTGRPCSAWHRQGEATQAQIGERLGVSQMHVSRLLSRTLAQLRAGMLTTH